MLCLDQVHAPSDSVQCLTHHNCDNVHLHSIHRTPRLLLCILSQHGFHTLMLIIFWLSYDGVLCIRASEEILRQLLSYEAPYVLQMPRAERVKVMKRARVMRVIEFPIGKFADFSINLPIAI